MARKKLIDGVIIEETSAEALAETGKIIGFDFSNQNMSAKKFNNHEYAGCDFTNAILQGCDFTNSTFTDCIFNNTDVRWSVGFPEDIIEGVKK